MCAISFLGVPTAKTTPYICCTGLTKRSSSRNGCHRARISIGLRNEDTYHGIDVMLVSVGVRIEVFVDLYTRISR